MCQCHSADNPKKLCYQCVVENCKYSLVAPANCKHILKHAVSCHHLLLTLWHEANALLADESPSARLDVLEGSSKPAEPVLTQESKKTQIKIEFGKANHNLLKAWLNFAIVKPICAATLLPIIMDTQEWKYMFSIANNTYRPLCNIVIINEHIPSEATCIYISPQHELFKNTTPPYDRGMTKQPRSICTVHLR